MDKDQLLPFENLIPNLLDYTISFEIHQKGNANILNGKLPLKQDCISSVFGDTIAIALNFLEKDNVVKEPPFGNLYGFSLSKQTNSSPEFILWFSPEKLLKHWWKGDVECEIEGDVNSFLKYKVHYVGKATKQNILRRLTGHSTLQDILSLEKPITYKDLPTHEIAILCFEFNDNLQFHVFGDNASVEEITASLLGENFPPQESISLDAEKALIRAMEPRYNKELFKNYPKSKDGLFKDNFDYISYTFIDPITLEYKDGEINGSLNYDGGDSIVIKDNKEFALIKIK